MSVSQFAYIWVWGKKYINDAVIFCESAIGGSLK